MKKLIIDGSNLRAGGGVTHIVEILNNIDEENFPFDKVIIFSNRKTLSYINESRLIEKRTHYLLNRSLPFILVWKLLFFESYLNKMKGTAVLLDPAGTYSGSFYPYVSMSRNMLIFETEESNRFQEWKFRKKFEILRKRQIKTFNKANGIIFISNYAKDVIIPYLNTKEKNHTLIHHGVSKRFQNNPKEQKQISEYSTKKPFQFLYVSPITVYKHQKNIVRAFHELYQEGYPIAITFIGDFYVPEFNEFNKTRASLDPKGKYTSYLGKVDYIELDKHYKNADGIVFASTCENMPNILIESMVSGTPLICSKKSPMPEFLCTDFPFFFDSTDINSIKNTTIKFLKDPKNRAITAKKNCDKAMLFDWAICANQTFEYLDKFN